MYKSASDTNAPVYSSICQPPTYCAPTANKTPAVIKKSLAASAVSAAKMSEPSRIFKRRKKRINPICTASDNTNTAIRTGSMTRYCGYIIRCNASAPTPNPASKMITPITLVATYSMRACPNGCSRLTGLPIIYSDSAIIKELPISVRSCSPSPTTATDPNQ